MRRVIVALWVIAILSVIVALSPVAGAQEQCTGGENQTELCDRIDELEEENSRLSAENTDLASENQELRYQLNNDEGFPDAMTRRMNQTGAWDLKKGEPSIFIVRGSSFPVMAQYVGPGNGERDLGIQGPESWEVLVKQEDLTSGGELGQVFPITFDLVYSNPGMNKTYTVESMAEYRRTVQELQDEMNTPEGYASYAQWNNDQRQSAESTGSWVWWTVALGVVGVFWGGLKYESVNQPMQRRREERRKERVGGQMNAFGGTISTKEQLLYYGEKYRVPIVLATAAVVGWVVL